MHERSFLSAQWALQLGSAPAWRAPSHLAPAAQSHASCSTHKVMSVPSQCRSASMQRSCHPSLLPLLSPPFRTPSWHPLESPLCSSAARAREGAGTGLLHALNQTTKWGVSASAAAVLVYRHDMIAAWWVQFIEGGEEWLCMQGASSSAELC